MRKYRDLEFLKASLSKSMKKSRTKELLYITAILKLMMSLLPGSPSKSKKR
jgi:hypothetical protein